MDIKTNMEINSYRNLALQFSQPEKYRLVVHSNCHWNVANLRASGLPFLEQSLGYLYVYCNRYSLLLNLYKKTRRKLIKNVNLKRE